jgi:hypothetical protein
MSSLKVCFQLGRCRVDWYKYTSVLQHAGASIIRINLRSFQVLIPDHTASQQSSYQRQISHFLDSRKLILEPRWWDPIGGTETSVRNYHCSLGNSPEERSSQLHSGGSLNSFTLLVSRQCDLLRLLIQFRTSVTFPASSSLQCRAEQRLVTRYALQLRSATRYLFQWFSDRAS